MKSFQPVLLALIIVFSVFTFSACQKNSPALNEIVSATSNAVQLGESENSFLILSEFFAEQIAAFDFEFGDFAITSKFIDRVSGPADSARLEILRNGELILTIFELRLSAEFTFEDVLLSLGSIDLQPATFGENTFYFLEQSRATNLLELENSAFSFSLDSQNFELARDFISSLLILR